MTLMILWVDLLLLVLQMMNEIAISVVSINPLSLSQMVQGAWFGKATRLGMAL